MNADIPSRSSITDPQTRSEIQSIENRFLKRESTRLERRAAGDKLKKQGDEFFREKNFRQAAEYYLKAVNAGGPKLVCFSNLAASRLKLKEYALAHEAATRALSCNAKAIKPRFRRAMARKEIRHLTGARIDLMIILEQDPNCEEAYDALDEVLRLIDIGEDARSSVGFNTLEWAWPLTVYKFDAEDYSGSSDCQHSGNGTPCRFYNHNGCKKGTQCPFSHAPDAYSVRDAIGKNVCMASIGNKCEFGDRCIYSHSKSFMPSATVKRTMIQAAVSLTDASSMDLTLERAKVMIVTKKTEIKAAPLKIDDKLPSVMLLSLANQESFDKIHEHLLIALRSKARVSQVFTRSQALKELSSPDLVAILVTDPGISKRKNAEVLTQVVAFAKSGGAVVIGGLFSSFIAPHNMDKFFLTGWGLPWTMGDYNRSWFELNNSSQVQCKDALASGYSMKAVYLKGTSPEQRVYERGDSYPQATVVYTKFEKGSVGYIGDVNGEIYSTAVVLSMLGLRA